MWESRLNLNDWRTRRQAFEEVGEIDESWSSLKAIGSLRGLLLKVCGIST